MSKTATVARRVDPAQLSELPTIYGAAGVIEFARAELGVTLTPSIVRRANESRRLRTFKISTRNVHAERDVYEFIMSLARGGDTGRLA